ncbi:MAG TPA: hypothetical protein VF972_04785 [Actinomycetota bacterium]
MRKRSVRTVDEKSTPAERGGGRRRGASRERRITYTRLLGLAFCVAGFVAIGLGWNGMARVACPDCQLPYLLSGGATGLGLIIFGATLLVMGQMRADRLRAESHLEEMVERLRPSAAVAATLRTEPSEQDGQSMVVAGPAAYHRPDCRLLRGKFDLPSLSIEDARDSGLAPCRVCNPLEQDVGTGPAESDAGRRGRRVRGTP